MRSHYHTYHTIFDCEKRSFRKRSSKPGNLKTQAFRFRVNGIDFGAGGWGEGRWGDKGQNLPLPVPLFPESRPRPFCSLQQ